MNSARERLSRVVTHLLGNLDQRAPAARQLIAREIHPVSSQMTDRRFTNHFHEPHTKARARDDRDRPMRLLCLCARGLSDANPRERRRRRNFDHTGFVGDRSGHHRRLLTYLSVEAVFGYFALVSLLGSIVMGAFALETGGRTLDEISR